MEKGPLREDRSTGMDIDVVRLRLETSALLTVQAMGAAIPVLLFLVELSTGRIYYVCLNDLVEKVILPRDPSYADRRTKVIHIPARNCIVPGNTLSLRPLETYARRAKLYAAFQKFSYQHHELELARAAYDAASSGPAERERADELMRLARHFVATVLRYDFWIRMPEWKPVGWAYLELSVLRAMLEDPAASDDLPSLRGYLVRQPWLPLRENYVAGLSLVDARRHFFSHVGEIWSRLANLSRIYEELVREWFLPTELAMRMGEDLGGAGARRPG